MSSTSTACSKILRPLLYYPSTLSMYLFFTLDSFIKRFSASFSRSQIFPYSAYDNDIDLRHWISIARQRRLHTLFLIVFRWYDERSLKFYRHCHIFFAPWNDCFMSLLKLNRSNEEVIYLNTSFYEELFPLSSSLYLFIWRHMTDINWALFTWRIKLQRKFMWDIKSI